MATKVGERSGRRAAPAGGWAATQLAGELWARFRDEARALGRAAWAAWLRALLIGLALACVVSVGLSAWARAVEPAWLGAWDQEQLARIIAGAPITFATAGVLESPGNMFGMWLLIFAGAALLVLAGRPVAAATLPVGNLIGVAVFGAGWLLWSRERPDLVAGGIAAPGLHSFPSGHMVHVVAIYGYLAYLWWRASGAWAERLLIAALLVAFCAVVGLSRLVLGTHWPSDILAGSLLGLIWMGVLIYADRAAEGRGP